MGEKLGKIVIDGKFVDLDKTPLDELKKIQKEISKKEEAKTEKIQRFLDAEEIDEER